MKTGFLFFDADHQLVGQFCTNPKSDRGLLSCLKVTQCSTSEIGDAPLYKSCSLPIQVMTVQHPQNANLDGSTLEGTAQRKLRFVHDINFCTYLYMILKFKHIYT